MKYILGIDQGGTKTNAIITDFNGCIKGFGSSFGACHFFDGVEKAMEAVKLASDIAMKASGASAKDLEYVYAGLAGANWQEEIDMLDKALKDIYPNASTMVCNDCMIALRAGTTHPYGTVICAGTGMNCAIISPAGDRFVYNSYVEEADQGGSAIGVRAIRAVYMSEIGALPPTSLTKKLLDFFKFNTVTELLYAQPRNMFIHPVKEVAFVLFEAADEGDKVASDLIKDFAKSISRYIVAGIKKYKMEKESFEVVVSGGLFKAKNPILVDSFKEEVISAAPLAKVVNSRLEPVTGAALFALDTVHKLIPEKIYKNFYEKAKAFNLFRN